MTTAEKDELKTLKELRKLDKSEWYILKYGTENVAQLLTIKQILKDNGFDKVLMLPQNMDMYPVKTKLKMLEEIEKVFHLTELQKELGIKISVGELKK